jgi:hypothetical protein
LEGFDFDAHVEAYHPGGGPYKLGIFDHSFFGPQSPLSQKMIREGILKYFEHNSAVGAQVAEAVFNNNRDRTEKISLRRSNRNSVSL